MHAISEFLLRHGYLLLLGWIFAEQLGFPVPSLPLLLAAGALAGTGRIGGGRLKKHAFQFLTAKERGSAYLGTLLG
jgi:membrane protein DedA with SNARE-associated domain